MNTIDTNVVLVSDIENIKNSRSSNLIAMTLAALRINLPSTKPAVLTKPNNNLKNNNDLLEISLQEVACHDSIDDCWIVLYDRVYDVTKFLDKHLGGGDIILEYAGRDATIAFRGTGHSKMALQQLEEYLIGELPLNQRLYRNNGSCGFLIKLSDIPD